MKLEESSLRAPMTLVDLWSTVKESKEWEVTRSSEGYLMSRKVSSVNARDTM